MKQSNLFGGSEPAIASTINYLEAEWTVVENNTDQKKTKIARTIGDEKSVRWVDWDAIGFTPDEPEPDESEPPTKSDDKPASDETTVYKSGQTIKIGGVECNIVVTPYKALKVAVPVLETVNTFYIAEEDIHGSETITFAINSVITDKHDNYFIVEKTAGPFAVTRNAQSGQIKTITAYDPYHAVSMNLSKIIREGYEAKKAQKSEEIPTATLNNIITSLRSIFEEEEMNAPADTLVNRLLSELREKSHRIAEHERERINGKNYDERDDKIKDLTRQVEQLKKTNQQQSQMLIAQVGASSANEWECDFVINQNAEKHAEMLNGGWEVEHMQFIPSGTPTRPMMCVTYKRRKATQKSIAPATGAITIKPVPAFEEAVLNRKSTAQDIINAGNGHIMAIGRDAFNS